MRCVYVLAAGKSERFGTDKLLKRVGDKTILEMSLDVAKTVGDVTLIVRPGFQTPGGFRILVNRKFEEGISSSVRLALEDAKRRRKCDEVVFFLGDMPLISPRTVDLVLKVAEKSHALVVFPVFKGKKGFPTVVKRGAFELLNELKGDEGFRKIIRRHPEICEGVEVDDGGCIFDVDTAEDFRTLVKALKERGGV